ncbi:Uncharacterized protein DBV15_12701 [Temnothorax longispinosus]|uniref:Uncharacterized protein n=1 Tax=Temnothorax longispinosus TaxID=300112 RepID=A0A4S2KSV5_9HYME|nr:Uncharacterized protein DBV15_12701 [Temnothorax longispinosus]
MTYGRCARIVKSTGAELQTINRGIKYHEVEANVIKRDGLVLVREMAMEVKNMMDFKMNAVMVR